MYEIRVMSGFSAAHYLRNYKGKCEMLHGHNWKVEAIVSSHTLDSNGLVMDFKELKQKLNNVLEEFDHVFLNEVEYFSAGGGSASGGKGHNPTSEEIAAYIFNRLKAQIPSTHTLKGITVWEKDTSCALYQE